MKSKQQKYAEAVDRNLRNVDKAKYRAIPLDLAARKLGIRKDDMQAQSRLARVLAA